MTLLLDLTRIGTRALEGLLVCLGVVIYYSGLARVVIRARRAPRVLMFHACAEKECDFLRGLAINTTPAQFGRQLDFLQRYYRVVPLEALCQPAPPECAVVITFDDGFRSVYEHAFPQLRARKLPATCYLVTDSLKRRSLIWVNELNWYLRRHPGVARPLLLRRLGMRRFCSRRRLVQAVISRYEPHLISELLTELRARLGPVTEAVTVPGRLFLDESEIEEMSRHGFTFGNHSASHAVLANLDAEACSQEIASARAVLAGLPASIDSLAYPFGAYSEVTERIARDLGYTTLLTVEGDNDPFDRYKVGRLNVTSMGPAVLFAKLELVAPLKSRIKRLLKAAR